MNEHGKFLGKRNGGEAAQTSVPEQALLVYLDGTGLPNAVYQECDIDTVEDKLIEILERDGLGEFDGIERGATDTTLFMYGPDAERLFNGIEQTLRAYPLCRGAQVVIRSGGPGTEERVIRL